MKRNTLGLLAATTVLLASAPLLLADDSNTLVGAITSGKAGVNLRARYERVDQDNVAQKADALTAHAFQGWADKFLTTPAAGINDVYATVKYKAGKWNLTGVYHDFSAETGSGDYGTEFDLSAVTKIAKNYGLLFKGAFFSGDTTAFPDTNKFWIMFTANY